MASVRLVLACLTLASALAGEPGIGARVGNLQLPDVSGQVHSLQSYAGRIVVLVFWSFKCPVSLSYDGRMTALGHKYAGKQVSVLAVASGANETPEEIRANVANLKIGMPVLLDSDGELAEKLGASHTPSVFILDGDGVVRYKGALDNNKKPGESGRIAYVEDALDALISGAAVALPETKAFGCSIKRR